MKKILKVKAKVTKEPGRTRYHYPDEYDSKKIQVLAYGGAGEENGERFGCLIGVVDESDFDQFIASDRIEELDYDTAVALGKEWRPQIEKIINVKKVLKVILKMVRKEELTNKEKDTIDPEKEEFGINKSMSFDKLLDNHLK